MTDTLKSVRVNMRSGEISIDRFDPSTLLGNRGLAYKVLCTEVDPRCNPLGRKNSLVLATGLFAGYGFPAGNRLSCCAKSPATGMISESSTGGGAGELLARHGIRLLVLEGQSASSDWHVLRVTAHGEVRLEPASPYMGKGSYETATLLCRHTQGAPPAACVIGPAGEALYSRATIQATDPLSMQPNRPIGPYGLGAVMGARQVKAIVVEPPARRTRLPAADRSHAHNILSELTRRYAHSSSAALLDTLNQAAPAPTAHEPALHPAFYARSYLSAFYKLCDDYGVDTHSTALAACNAMDTGKLPPGDIAATRAFIWNMLHTRHSQPSSQQQPASRRAQLWQAVGDNISCVSAKELLTQPETKSLILELFYAVYARDMGTEKLLDIGKRTLAYESKFNSKAGRISS